MKRNNGGENHASGPKETFRRRRHQQHPEEHNNVAGKLKTQGQSRAALLCGSNVYQSVLVENGDFAGVALGIHISAEPTHVEPSCHIVNQPPTMCAECPVIGAAPTAKKNPTNNKPKNKRLHGLKPQTVSSVTQHTFRGNKWYPRSRMPCQIHATRSARDSRGMNYRSVARVTSRTHNTPCHGLEEKKKKTARFVWFLFRKAMLVIMEKEDGTKDVKEG